MRCIKRQCRLMGSAFELGVLALSEKEGNELLDLGVAEISRIEDKLTEFKPGSETSMINDAAGLREVRISRETLDLLMRCRQMYRVSDGSFDITTAPLKHLYSFKGEQRAFPERAEIKKALRRVGFSKLILNEEKQTAFLQDQGMKISFAAIGKGYASDAVRSLWKRQGVVSGYVNASGDLCAFGQNELGKPWRVSIMNPDQKDNVLFHMPLQDAAVATSGDYEQFFTHKGKRYSHTINPLTGMPLTGIKSVSIVSPSAELSDALATTVYTLGAKGLDLLNQLPNTYGIIISDKNEVHFSKDIEYEETA